MQNLITYRCEVKGSKVIWGYTIETDVMAWLGETQEYDDEVYFIVNVLPISDYEEARWNDNLKGM